MNVKKNTFYLSHTSCTVYHLFIYIYIFFKIGIPMSYDLNASTHTLLCDAPCRGLKVTRLSDVTSYKTAVFALTVVRTLNRKILHSRNRL